MTTYYIMYGEPPRRPRWVYFVLGMATAAAVIAVGAAFAVLPAFPGIPPDPQPATASPDLNEPASPERWCAAIAEATTETAVTYYLVDTSGSMERELANAMAGLNDCIAAKSPGSTVGVIAFANTCADKPLPLMTLSPELVGLAAQGELVRNVAIGRYGNGTNVKCALDLALDKLRPYAEQEPPPEVVLFSDGSLASVIDAECSGDVIRSAGTLEGSPLFQCSGEWSYQPLPIIDEFIAAAIPINGIYFQPHRHDWADQVELLTKETGGVFVKVRP